MSECIATGCGRPLTGRRASTALFCNATCSSRDYQRRMRAGEIKRTRCCPHKGWDHPTFGHGGNVIAGGICSIPGCACRGWLPQPKRKPHSAGVAR